MLLHQSTAIISTPANAHPLNIPRFASTGTVLLLVALILAVVPKRSHTRSAPGGRKHPGVQIGVLLVPDEPEEPVDLVCEDRPEERTEGDDPVETQVSEESATGIKGREAEIQRRLGYSDEDWEKGKHKRGKKPEHPIVLEDDQIDQLILMARSHRGHRLKARVLLLATCGWSNTAISKDLKPSRTSIIKWRELFNELGMASLAGPMESKDDSLPVTEENPQDQRESLSSALKSIDQLESRDENVAWLLQHPELFNHPLLFQTIKRLRANRSRKKPRSIDDAESDTAQEAKNWGLDALQDEIDEAGTGDVGPRLKIDGRIYKRRDITPRKLLSIFGTLQFRGRRVYRSDDSKGVRPLDAWMRLPAGQTTPKVDLLLNKLSIHMSYDEAIAMLNDFLSIDVSKGTAERRVSERSVDFENFYETRKGHPELEKEFIIAGIDGKGIQLTMEEEKRLKIQRKKVEQGKSTKKRGAGRQPGKKMATVITVHSADQFVRTVEDVMKEYKKEQGFTRPPRIENKRVFASVDRSVIEMAEQLWEEMLRRDPTKSKVWVLLVDGEDRLKEAVRAVWGPRLRGQFIEILDLYHVIERLWEVAHMFHPSLSAEAQSSVAQYLRMLLNGHVKQAIAHFHQLAETEGITAHQSKKIKRHANYMNERKDMMRYNEFLTMGLPIATGVVEGACKHLVKDRFERAGMLWTIAGAEALLKLRSIERSGDFDEYWPFHRKAECQRLYPESWTIPPRRPTAMV